MAKNSDAPKSARPAGQLVTEESTVAARVFRALEHQEPRVERACVLRTYDDVAVSRLEAVASRAYVAALDPSFPPMRFSWEET